MPSSTIATSVIPATLFCRRSQPVSITVSVSGTYNRSRNNKVYTRLDSCLVIPPPPKFKKSRAIIKFLGGAFLPLLRWKRFALVASMCILAVRAIIVQIAFYLHIQTHVFGRPILFTRPLIFATAFMSFFSVVIALFKDIPDIEGDKIFRIRSFSVSLGQKPVFWTCVSLLQMAYAIAILVGATSPFIWSKVISVTFSINYGLCNKLQKC